MASYHFQINTAARAKRRSTASTSSARVRLRKSAMGRWRRAGREYARVGARRSERVLESVGRVRARQWEYLSGVRARAAARALTLGAGRALVEADRREQLGRAQAAAERRVERRQGLGIGGQLKEKLIAQARALRERIGRELGRVKEWVRERFPDPLKQLKERSREVFEAVAEKARGRERKGPAREPEKEPERGQSGDKKRGMFDGLRLRSERLAAPAERDVSSSKQPSVQQEPSRGQGRDRAAEALNRSVDRYARAWMDA